MRSRLAALALLAAAPGCYHIKYVTETPGESTPAYDAWQHNFIYGLVNASGPVRVSEVCPQGFSVVETKVTFLNWFASAAVQGAANGAVFAATRTEDRRGVYFPFDIWSPQTVKVTCSVRAPTPG